MRIAGLIYPHQLYVDHPVIRGCDELFVVEDPLFFRQFAFHRQKLILHRASMKRYAADRVPHAKYVDAHRLDHTSDILKHVIKAKCDTIRVVDPCDDWLLRRLKSGCDDKGIPLEVLEDPHFLTPKQEMDSFAKDREKLFFTDFYIRQRKRLGVLLTPNSKPVGGKWSFDAENRKRLPKQIDPPIPLFPPENQHVREARDYVRKHFPDAPGSDSPFLYPTSTAEARKGLTDFLDHRFTQFGEYEDAISTRGRVLFHSILSPAMNIGLLSPQEIVDAALARMDQVPYNSLEGFVRQVIGWREFVRLVYLNRGRKQRTCNYWKYTQKLPQSFYTATTGILPVDHVIRSVLETGYCHHIERLMILGNFMLLCDFAPDDVYQWFMEMFIDAYDWVMVPNVYGMSQFADGGTMTTKPYISGSSYVCKMSDFPKGDWCKIWDALYWRFIDTHVDFFRSNPRMSVMVGMRDKLGSKLKSHLEIAEQYLFKVT